ncbi:unnamed protein product, partial [Trichogramma brassicae]
MHDAQQLRSSIGTTGRLELKNSKDVMIRYCDEFYIILNHKISWVCQPRIRGRGSHQPVVLSDTWSNSCVK